MRSLGRAPTELEVKEYQKSVDKGDGSFNIDGARPLFRHPIIISIVMNLPAPPCLPSFLTSMLIIVSPQCGWLPRKEGFGEWREG
jgi:hypothetical protein